MATNEYTYEQIVRDLKARKYAPVYFLMGEEDYYIDRISEIIEESVLAEEEKDFNLSILYGLDYADRVADIVTLARRYPMMADHQVIILREAQMVRNLDGLAAYLQRPLESTILVVCYMHGTYDRRKKLTSLALEKGVLFDSKRLKESMLPRFISSYLKGMGLAIDDSSAQLLAEHVGNNLSRLTGELKKLALALPQGEKRITADVIEQNVGISKEYNVFELRTALAERNAKRVSQIVSYMTKNSKQNPVQPIFANLFSYFANLMLAYYAPQKTAEGIAAFLGLRSPWAARDYISGMRNYSAMKVLQIIRQIRLADARSKGVDATGNLTDAENFRELTLFILQ